MQNRPYFEQLSTTLNHHLPAAHARRLMLELSDHFEDASAENESLHAEHVLGNPTLLAESIVSDFRRQTFAGRHPWLCVLTLPVLGTLLAPLGGLLVCMFFILVALPFVGVELINGDTPNTLGFAFGSFSIHFTTLMSFVALTAVIAGVWKRTGRGVWWLILAIGIQVLATSLVVCQLDLTPDQLQVGLHMGTDIPYVGTSNVSAARILGQMMLPLFFGGAIILRQLVDSRRARSGTGVCA